MSRSYRFSNTALGDLNSLLEYTTQMWGRLQAQAYINDLMDRLDWILVREDLSRAEPEYPPLRSYPHRQHRIYFRIETDLLIVARILHQSQDPARHLGDD